MRIKAVMFDLDGTLLPMDQDEFIRMYFGLLAKALAPHGYEPKKLVDTVYKGTYVMIKNDGSCTNEQAFWTYFASVFGEEARRDEPIFEQFYRTDFALAREKSSMNPKAAETIARVKEMGLRAILATNPVFPAIATESRIGWAGLKKEDFELVTTYENSGFCKPNPHYFEEILRKTGLQAEECLMVGNDAADDLAAAKLGIPVFILTDCLINANGTDLSGIPHGSFDELVRWIGEMCRDE